MTDHLHKAELELAPMAYSPLKSALRHVIEHLRSPAPAPAATVREEAPPGQTAAEYAATLGVGAKRSEPQRAEAEAGDEPSDALVELVIPHFLACKQNAFSGVGPRAWALGLFEQMRTAGYTVIRSSAARELAELRAGAELADKLVDLLLPHAGDGGKTEGAVECLARKLSELAERDERIRVLEEKIAAWEPAISEGVKWLKTPAQSHIDAPLACALVAIPANLRPGAEEREGT